MSGITKSIAVDERKARKSEYNKLYFQRNKERIMAKRAERSEQDKEMRRQYQKQYYQTHREIYRQRYLARKAKSEEYVIEH